MIPILASLVGLGVDFVGDMIESHGEDLVTEGIKKVTGVDIGSGKKLSPGDIAKIKAMKMDELELAMKNVANARNMQASALAQSDVFSKRFVYYYAIGITGFTFIYIFAITFLNIPEDSVRFADTVLGFLLGVGLSAIINFFYGSSYGNEEATKLLRDK